MYVAATGQTRTHGGLSQCMQGRGTKRMLVSGNSPSTSVITFIQASVRPMSDWSGGTVATLFSLLQATSHAPQPVQRSRSITMPQRVMIPQAGSSRTNVVNQALRPVSGSPPPSSSCSGLAGSPPRGGDLDPGPIPGAGRDDPRHGSVSQSQGVGRRRMQFHPGHPVLVGKNRRLLPQPGLQGDTTRGDAGDAIGNQAQREAGGRRGG